MLRAFLVIVVLGPLLLASCTQRLICPAYQSAYIYDKDQLRKKFSYFVGDSTPKVYAANKNKYLIAEPTSYKKKVRSLQTVPMKRVNTVVPDSLKGDSMNDDMSADMDVSNVERNVNDSTAVLRIDTLASEAPQDSVYIISKDRETRVLRYKPMERKYYVDTVGFNSEQDTYMWYLRDVLVLPDARLSQQEMAEGGKGTDGKKEKKGLKGFFKNLFKKKDKSKVLQDSTQKVQEEEDYGYDDFEGKVKDSTAVETEVPETEPQPAAKPKKGLFKKKEKAPKPKKETDPAKKEDTDDGF